MRRHCWTVVALLLLPLALPAAAATAPQWRAGQNYFVIDPPVPTSVPAGKIEVTEVFSYACPACNQFYPVADRLRESLPPNAVMDYVSAAFNPSEDWPVFQRAYYTAKALGVAAKTHDLMFDAVWKSRQLAVYDQSGEHLKSPLPTIEDVAEFYQRRAGISKARFLAAANSFAVNLDMRRADAYITSAQVDETPTLIVDGKYRLTVPSAGGYNQTIELVKWLVAKASHH
ncbi:MAG: thiol:disulfide interchange protein DsbA/DsbL [Steroidobacteraceae bacterium]